MRRQNRDYREARKSSFNRTGVLVGLLAVIGLGSYSISKKIDRDLEQRQRSVEIRRQNAERRNNQIFSPILQKVYQRNEEKRTVHGLSKWVQEYKNKYGDRSLEVAGKEIEEANRELKQLERQKNKE